MKYKIFIFVLFFIGKFIVSGEIRIVDETGYPIVCATVVSKDGKILGYSNVDGIFQAPPLCKYPIEIRCVGFESRLINSKDTILKMIPVVHQLDDLVVQSSEKPIVSYLCYIRELSTGDVDGDSLTYFAEHMARVYLNPKKIKGFKSNACPILLRTKSYVKLARREKKDSIYTHDYPIDEFSWIQFITFPTSESYTKIIEKNQQITNDIISGEYGIKNIIRTDSLGFGIFTDYLADKKSHKWSPMLFKILGMTTEFSEFSDFWRFQTDGNQRCIDLAAISYGRSVMDLLAKGKWLKMILGSKNPVHMHSSIEIFPVSVEFHSVEDAKLMRKNDYDVKTDIPFTYGPICQPLPENLQNLKNKFQE